MAIHMRERLERTIREGNRKFKRHVFGPPGMTRPLGGDLLVSCGLASRTLGSRSPPPDLKHPFYLPRAPGETFDHPLTRSLGLAGAL